MKKHGFTLIELLAVIVILAIIALIATPIVMNVIEKSKKGAAERSAENYISAVETKAATERLGGKLLEGEYIIQSDGNLCPVSGCGIDDVQKLTIDMSGSKPASGTLVIENSLVTIDSILKIGDYIVSYDENKKSYAAVKAKIISTTNGILTLDGNTTLSNYRIYGNSVVSSRLPQDYQEVEYVGVDDLQFIDTKLKFNNKYQVSMKFKYSRIGYGENWLTSDWKNNRGLLIGIYHRKLFLYAGDENSPGIKYSISADTLEHEVTINKSGVNYDGNLVAKTNFDDLPNLDRSIKLFASNHYNVNNNQFTKYIYWSKFWNMNDELVRYYIPCYRKEDGEIGMYDTVNDVFYTNAGTGTFLKGNDVYKIESVGEYDENLNKYKIPIKVNDNVTNIYLDEPLRKIGDYADYIDYANQKVVRNVEVLDSSGTLPLEESLQGLTTPREEAIELPKISIFDVTTILSVDTNIKPSNFEVEYKNN